LRRPALLTLFTIMDTLLAVKTLLIKIEEEQQEQQERREAPTALPPPPPPPPPQASIAQNRHTEASGPVFKDTTKYSWHPTMNVEHSLFAGYDFHDKLIPEVAAQLVMWLDKHPDEDPTIKETVTELQKETQKMANSYLNKTDGPDRYRFTPYVVRGLQLAAAVNCKVSGVAESGLFKGTLLGFALPDVRRSFMSCSGEYVLRLALDKPQGNLHVVDVRISAKAWHSGSPLAEFQQEEGTTVEEEFVVVPK